MGQKVGEAVVVVVVVGRKQAVVLLVVLLDRLPAGVELSVGK